jgi:hypothetical protein
VLLSTGLTCPIQSDNVRRRPGLTKSGAAGPRDHFAVPSGSRVETGLPSSSSGISGFHNPARLSALADTQPADVALGTPFNI